MALAEFELSDAVTEHLDIDGILAFAEYLLTDVSRLWTELGLDQKQRLQKVLFPEGLKFDGREFGTAVTCLAFKEMRSPTERNQVWGPQRQNHQP